MHIIYMYILLLQLISLPNNTYKDTGTSDVPVPIYPYLNALTNSDRPNFIWHSTISADSYNIIVKKILLGGMDTLTILNTTTTDTFYIPQTSLSTGEYTWKVAAFLDTGGISDYSLNISFKVDIDPPVVYSTSPTGYINSPTPLIRAIYSDNFSGIIVGKNMLIIDNDTVNAQQNADSIWFVPTYDLAENSHRITVIVFDSANNRTEYSWTFEIDHTPPNTPILLSPSNNEYIKYSYVNFIWHKAMKKYSPVEYELIISTDSFFQNILIDSLNIADTSVFINNLPESKYYWQICPKDNAGNTGNCSDIFAFTIDTTSPETPLLIYPSNNAVINTLHPTLLWSRSTDASKVSYHCIVSTIPFKSTIIDTIIQDTFLTVSLSEDERTYFWTVRAIDQAGNVSPERPLLRFNVDTTSPLILYTSIVNDTFYSDSLIDLLIVFNENNQLDTSNSYILFNSHPISYAISSDTIYSTITSQNTDSAMIQIHLIDIAGNYVDTSLIFGIDYTQPAIPLPISPKNDTLISTNNITFIWTHSTLKSPVKYQIQCSIDSAFNFNIIDTIITDTILSVNYLPDNTYFWRVQAFDLAGNTSGYSIPTKFTVNTSGIHEDVTKHLLTTTYRDNRIIFKIVPTIKQKIHLTIYDHVGRVVYTTTLSPANQISYTWKDNSGKTLPKGTYYYQIKTKKLLFRGKLIKY